MNAKARTESHVRIASLKRKIFWRDTLSFLFCVIPFFILGASTYWVFNAGGWTIFFAGFFTLIGFAFWLTGNFDNAANFLFGDEFRIQSERFLETEKARLREAMRREKAQREEKEAAIIAALEHDMRLAGILKDPTKETES